MPGRGAVPLPLQRDELREWVPRIREAAADARDTHVLMNNCYANYGSTNARELAAMLERELAEGEGEGGAAGSRGSAAQAGGQRASGAGEGGSGAAGAETGGSGREAAGEEAAPAEAGNPSAGAADAAGRPKSAVGPQSSGA